MAGIYGPITEHPEFPIDDERRFTVTINVHEPRVSFEDPKTCGLCGFAVSEPFHTEPKPPIRPKAKIIGADGNVFNIVGIAGRALQNAGQTDRKAEMYDRIQTTAHSYGEALSIICEYVEPV